MSEHLPDWKYQFWTDAELDTFVEAHYPAFYPAWKALNKPIKRVDMARYFILHHYGGVYADLDFIFTRPLEDLLDDESRLYFYISKEAQVKDWKFLGNAFMMSAPAEPFWIELIESMLKLPADTHVLRHTGPRAIGAYYASLASKPALKILGPDIFDNDICTEGVGLHQYGYHMRIATWQHPDNPHY